MPQTWFKPDHHDRDGSFSHILATLIILFAVSVCLSLIPYQVDDAFITYRYVVNALSGNGIVFNPGAEPVEGFTSPLWFTLLLLLSWPFDTNYVPYFSAFLGAVFFVTLLFSVYGFSAHYLKTQSLPQKTALAVLGLVCLLPGAVFYSVTGLETTFFVAFVVIFHFLGMDDYPYKYYFVFGVLAFFVRPEAPGAFIVLLFSQLLTKSYRPKVLEKRNIIFAVSVLAGGVLLFVFRWIYFRSVLPNTFYAKMPSVLEGVQYLSSFLKTPTGSIIALMAVLGALFGRPFHRYFFFGGLGWGFAAVVEGGDWMPEYRFLLPMAIFFSVAATGLLVSKNRFCTTPVKSAAMLTIALLITFHGYRTIEIRGKARFSYDKISQRERIVGRWLRENGIESFAAVDIGAAGFYSNVHVVDIVGLTDKYVSHSPGGHLNKQYDLDYVFSVRNPEVLILRSTIRPDIEDGILTRCRAGSEIEERILLDNRLLENYVFAFSFEIEGNPEESKLIFLRRGSLEKSINLPKGHRLVI